MADVRGARTLPPRLPVVRDKEAVTSTLITLVGHALTVGAR
jgi:hypothetical protein